MDIVGEQFERVGDGFSGLPSFSQIVLLDVG
jgi:hypothetical protein